MRTLAMAALIFAVSVTLTAQRAAPFHASGFPGHSNSFTQHFGHRGYHPGSYESYGMAYIDPFYMESLPTTGSPPVSEPPVIVVQSPPSAPAVESSPAPAQPLMIELQGDRYVQVSGGQPSRAQMIDDAVDRKPPAQAATIVPPPPSSTMLVFRDGHRQEVSAFTIADGALYASADYATTGLWTQKIELTSLNIPETMAINSSHGIHFKLPTAPNEVIVGP